MNRRLFMTATAAAATSSLLPAALHGKRMGIVIHSYWKRWHGKYSNLKYPSFEHALDVLDHVRDLGVGSLQTLVGGWTSEFAEKVRATCESYGIKLEGSITLPKTENDVGRFEGEVRIAKEAGATIFRSATGGRRYELFSSLEDFKHWKDGAFKSMQLAEPVLRRQHVKIGIENHKDFHAAELAEMLGRLSSPHVGACVDTGNSISLLEDPMTVVETLAPFAVTTHIKDMAVQETPTGFLLAEVPLGEGILDLPRMFALFEKYNPQIDYFLEMITRDPLDIPCLKPAYWTTFPDKPGTELARTLMMVRAHKAAKMPGITGLGLESELDLEEANIVKCLRQAADRYGFIPSIKPKAASKKDEH
jgi:sugar phosphate isomerase/epimerase